MHSRRALMASSSVPATVTPFPAARPSAFTTKGRGVHPDVALGLLVGVEDLRASRRDEVLGHKLLGEDLAALDARCRGLCRAEDGKIGGLEVVHNALRQWRLRSHDSQVHTVKARRLRQPHPGPCRQWGGWSRWPTSRRSQALRTIRLTRGLCLSFQAMACSLAPPPTTNALKPRSLRPSCPWEAFSERIRMPFAATAEALRPRLNLRPETPPTHRKVCPDVG